MATAPKTTTPDASKDDAPAPKTTTPDASKDDAPAPKDSAPDYGASDSSLVTMYNPVANPDTIGVHPSCVKAHESAGWKVKG
jgi:hypothetical protein